MKINDRVQKNGPDYKPYGPPLTITYIEDRREQGGAGDVMVCLSDGTKAHPWNLFWIEGEN